MISKFAFVLSVAAVVAPCSEVVAATSAPQQSGAQISKKKLSIAEAERLAKAGDARAQWILAGWLLNHKKNDPHAQRDAIQWLTRSAEQGFAHAQYLLGMSFLSGKGVPQDSARGVTLLRTAAKSKDTDARAFALYGLGVSYEFGLGAKQSNRLAYALYASSWGLMPDEGTNQAQDRLAAKMSGLDVAEAALLVGRIKHGEDPGAFLDQQQANLH